MNEIRMTLRLTMIMSRIAPQSLMLGENIIHAMQHIFEE